MMLAVDIAIGLVLVFLLLSGLVSAVFELIASRLNLRGRFLEIALIQMLDGYLPRSPPLATWNPLNKDFVKELRAKGRATLRVVTSRGGLREDPDPTSLASAVLHHGLIDGLLHGERLPSYISPDRFADALLDILRRRAGDTVPTPEGLSWAIGRLPTGYPAEALGTMLTATGGDATRFRAALAGWYTDTMDRVTGWYKRDTMFWQVLLGLGVAILLNVDAIYLTATIARNAPLRERLVQAAPLASTDHADEAVTDPNITLDASLRRLEALDLPIGWPACNLRPSPEPQQDPKAPTCDPTKAWEWSYLPQAVLGWMITAVAITLGAPIWFGLLQNLLRLRGAGVKPDGAVPTTAAATPAIDPVRWASSPEPAAGAAFGGPVAPAIGPADAFEASFLSMDDIRLLQAALGVLQTGALDAALRARIRDWQRARVRAADGLLTPELVREILAQHM